MRPPKTTTEYVESTYFRTGHKDWDYGGGIIVWPGNAQPYCHTAILLDHCEMSFEILFLFGLFDKVFENA